MNFECYVQISDRWPPVKITKRVRARNLLGYVRTLRGMWSLSATAAGEEMEPDPGQ
jgi:hypothetical protein